MKTLYVTDLDGTLLNSDSKLSTYTIESGVIPSNDKDGVAHWLHENYRQG